MFVTIAKFGALNCALIGLARKMLSLVLSFVLYGHTINAVQTVGLSLALVSMIANFYEKVMIIVLHCFVLWLHTSYFAVSIIHFGH